MNFLGAGMLSSTCHISVPCKFTPCDLQLEVMCLVECVQLPPGSAEKSGLSL